MIVTTKINQHFKNIEDFLESVAPQCVEKDEEVTRLILEKLVLITNELAELKLRFSTFCENLEAGRLLLEDEISKHRGNYYKGLQEGEFVVLDVIRSLNDSEPNYKIFPQKYYKEE